MRRVGRPGLIGTAARTAVIAGTAQAVTGNVARRQQQRYAAEQAQAAPPPPAAAPPAAAPPAAAPPAPPAPPAGGNDIVATLERLASLHSAGMLTDEEFAAAKASALA